MNTLFFKNEKKCTNWYTLFKPLLEQDNAVFFANSAKTAKLLAEVVEFELLVVDDGEGIDTVSILTEILPVKVIILVITPRNSGWQTTLSYNRIHCLQEPSPDEFMQSIEILKHRSP